MNKTFLIYSMVMLSFVLTTVFIAEANGYIPTMVTQLVCFILIVYIAVNLDKKENT